MTYIDLVKYIFPDATDKQADFILWEKTPFPLVQDRETLEEYLKMYKEELEK